MEHLRYPVGRFKKPAEINKEILNEWIGEIERFPEHLKEVLSRISEADLGFRYRPEGWTIRQVVHHCADSHMNSIIRFKLALTEDSPTIKPYFEERWAELPDTAGAPVEYSILILEGLHKRWGILLRSLDDEMWSRKFVHPEHGREFTLKENLGIYAWHCRHHLAHIKQALEFKGR